MGKKKGKTKGGGFTPIYKTKSYFSRYQVKFRRRREGKTNYRARRKLVAQDKTKYNAKKSRFVVRISNQYVVCQIIHSKLIGDVVMASAYSSELPRYGLKVGLKNYSAAYATGLLLARRVNQQLGLDKKYEGVTEADGEFFLVEKDDTRRPFKCALDIGLANRSTGARVWGALKGACDGGLNVPHSERRFPGFFADEKNYEAEFHKNYIFGGHVKDWMETLQEEDPETYKTQFANYIAEGLGPDDLEALYEKVHSAIREDPSPSPKNVVDYRPKNPKSKRHRLPKQSLKQRKHKIFQKKAAIQRYLAESESDDDEGDEEDDEEDEDED